MRCVFSDLLVCEHDSGKGLVDFVKGNVVGGDTGHLEGPGNCLGGCGGKLLGVVGGIPEAPDEGEGLEVEGGGLLGTHEDQRAGTVVELGGVGGRDGANLLEGRLQRGDLVKFDSLVLLVLGDDGVWGAPGPRDSDGHNFTTEDASL